MKIYNKKELITGITWLLITIVGVIAFAVKGMNIMLMILTVLMLILSCIAISRSFSNRIFKEELSAVDERDKLIVMKSGHKALQILSYVFLSVFTIFMIAYGIVKASFLLVVLITLGATMLFMWILLLVLNIYYETHN
ncbi:MAG: hypothetical protein ACRC3H_06510 [Lachnospiraceae bacterium]